jgi:hypothetical protein
MTTPRRPPDEPTLPEPPPSEEEARAAEELRDALANMERVNEDADLLRALALADRPRPLGADEHRAILERAFAAADARPRRTGRLIRITFGAVAASLAVAASVVLLVQPGEPPRSTAAAVLAHVRSTQPLFREPFARQGGESARVDRIALARANDFRDNEFSRWGVR